MHVFAIIDDTYRQTCFAVDFAEIPTKKIFSEVDRLLESEPKTKSLNQA